MKSPHFITLGGGISINADFYHGLLNCPHFKKSFQQVLDTTRLDGAADYENALWNFNNLPTTENDDATPLRPLPKANTPSTYSVQAPSFVVFVHVLPHSIDDFASADAIRPRSPSR